MTAGARLTVVGDALLDRDVEGDVRRLAPDAPVPVLEQRRTATRPGGAGLAAALAAASGHDVRLVTATADDAAGAELRAGLRARGVELVDLGLRGPTPEKVRLRAQGRALLRLDRGGAPPPFGAAGAAVRAAIRWADGVLVSDYGRGVAADPGVRAAIAEATRRRAPIVWDPHPRGAAPVPAATLVTPNDDEARRFASGDGDAAGEDERPGAVAARARALRERWAVGWVCVTRGRAGAVAVGPGGVELAVPAEPVALADPCGAGDRFASHVAAELAAGASVPAAIAAAVAAATAFVAAGGADAVDVARPARAGETETAASVVARVRAAGGTVVATGGCFDLLHPGHVRTLQGARALGDCLVVCLNSDASVRRLKGPGRPVVAAADRAALLAALECVDAVEVFDEDTPVALLERLRPDLWVKGGDYRAADLPEAALVRSWGGRALVLPLLEGRSTTALIERGGLHAV